MHTLIDSTVVLMLIFFLFSISGSGNTRFYFPQYNKTGEKGGAGEKLLIGDWRLEFTINL